MTAHVRDTDLKVLVLEPYFGGSHKHFLEGLKKYVPFKYHFMTLPAQKWKWRMRLAAPGYAELLHKSGERFDRILCSTFVDVAAFRGLAPKWVREVPLITYFHENQFVYPVQVENERDFHFALTNMTTALASDRLAFNSSYNMESFLEGIEKLFKKSHDLKLDNSCELIRSKSSIIPPAIDFTVIDKTEEFRDGHYSVLLWNHRWEYDKNPDRFFEALITLDKEGHEFRLVILGESFKDRPPIFERARKELSERILFSGFARDRTEYARWLKRSTVAVSTSLHEFFGIAMMESVRAGCMPLLPHRLSYPELFPAEYLYDEDDFIDHLRTAVLKGERLTFERARELTDPYSWRALAPEFMKWIGKS
jgi:glycosyltransferase involved in cell wall biosynthesis